MTLDNICLLFDSYFIAEKQGDINTKYVASSELIFSDGTFDHRVNSDGYINISNVRDAEYIMFIDQNGDVFLAIYKNIFDLKFKDIVNNINTIRHTTGMKKHSIINHIDSSNHNISTDKIALTGDLVDINTFTCPECNSSLIFTKLQSSDTVLANCKKCNMEYALVPSRYYIIKASKQIYDSAPESVDTSIFKNSGGKING